MSESGDRTDGEPLPEVVARCVSVLRSAPAGLVTDIDGTISAIAPTPAEAVVESGARAALARLAGRLAYVGVISGRAALVGEAMVGVPGLTYVGNHGMERSLNGVLWEHPMAVSQVDAIRSALLGIGEAAVAAGLDDGLVVENKRLSGTVHYRLAPDPLAERGLIRAAAEREAAARGLRVTEGRFIVELRPMVRIDKGTAIVDLVAERALKGIVFLGDDLTDVDGFVAVRELRQRGDVAGLRVGVIGPETPAAVTAEVDVTIDGVVACARVLSAIADALDRANDVANLRGASAPPPSSANPNAGATGG